MWQIIDGVIPVLLVAGHNAPHLRNGKIKKRDWGTGDMVKYLCEKTGAFGIITTEIQIDPNYHEEAELRKEVIKIIGEQEIELVIDIHGRRADYPYLIEFFTNKHFLNEFLKGEMVFKAEVRTQKLLVKALEIPGVEVEIRKDGRTWGEENFEVVINKLEKLINSFAPPLTSPHPLS